MRIVQIIPSTGDSFYCDNCLRDVWLVRALRKLGHDAVMVPMYLPVQIEEDESRGDSPIFFGGINVYLQQKSGFFRKSPRWIDRLFDSPRLLRWVSSRAGMTSAKSLGQMTISMLQAEEGRQAKELNRLIEWLERPENKPDVVCLSNAMLMGLAPGIGTRLEATVLCLLQDEDGFLDALGEPYSKQAWQLLRELADNVDAFVAVSRYYSDIMRERLRLSAERVRVVYTGISLDEYKQAETAPEVPTIGFLSRMCLNKGLDTLVEAFIRLKRNDKLKNARLRVAGGRTSSDEAFLTQIRERLKANDLIDDVEFLPSFDLETRLGFLQTLSVLSVPEKQPVAYAVYVLEALAAGVPVAEPASGVFPELLEMTGGGVQYEPGSAAALAAALESLLLDANYARRLGKQGREAVSAKFDVNQTAEEIVRICEQVRGGFGQG